MSFTRLPAPPRNRDTELRNLAMSILRQRWATGSEPRPTVRQMVDALKWIDSRNFAFWGDAHNGALRADDTPAGWEPGMEKWVDQSRRREDASAGAVGNRLRYRPPLGRNYVFSGGGAESGWVSTPHHPSFEVGEEMDLIVRVSLREWTASDGTRTFIGRFLVDGGNRSFTFDVIHNGALRLLVSEDGLNNHTFTVSYATWSSAVNPNATGGVWLRATRVSSTGVTRFYASDRDVPVWVMVGETTLAPGAIPKPVEVNLTVWALRPNGDHRIINGLIHYAEMRTQIDGEPVAVFDPARMSVGDTTLEWNDLTWTINGGAFVTGQPAIVNTTPTGRLLLNTPVPLSGVSGATVVWRGRVTAFAHSRLVFCTAGADNASRLTLAIDNLGAIRGFFRRVNEETVLDVTINPGLTLGESVTLTLVVSFEAGKGYVYRDGVLIGQGDLPTVGLSDAAVSTHTSFLNAPRGDHPATAEMYAAGILEYALTPAEVSELHNHLVNLIG